MIVAGARTILVAAFSSMLLLPSSASAAHAQDLVVITGEWPPYDGVQEPQGGSITAVVRSAFAAAGMNVRVGFFDWYRMVDLLKENPEYVASFPHYYSPERAEHCYFSHPVGESPLGLAERRAAPLHWQTTADLDRYRIGTVKTYINTPEFDAQVKAGKIRTLAATSDEDNLLNLINGKVDAAIIDRNVYAYLLSHTSSLGNAGGRLQLNPQVLIVQQVYVCFPKSADGRNLRDQFNKGLKTLMAPVP